MNLDQDVSKYLLVLQLNILSALRILYLAGGLVGIASGILGAKEVIMTDLIYAMPLLEENIDRNKQAWQGKCQNIQSKVCDWYHPPPITELCCGSSSVASNNSSDAMIDDDGIVCSVDVDGDIDGHEKHPIQYPE